MVNIDIYFGLAGLCFGWTRDPSPYTYTTRQLLGGGHFVAQAAHSIDYLDSYTGILIELIIINAV
jgi:hypothetical protein